MALQRTEHLPGLCEEDDYLLERHIMQINEYTIMSLTPLKE